MPRSDFIETEGTITRLRGHGFYTVVLANGHEVLARMSGRMTKNHIRVIRTIACCWRSVRRTGRKGASFTAISDPRYDLRLAADRAKADQSSRTAVDDALQQTGPGRPTLP